ncbi:unnamed protein product [Rotaria sordida]|uniref:Mutator-like transposase domain-containing protein n=1 Tax=Rotaria sordida TaxID=392033 RepID=A0A815AZN8_9BILA|nr:unnamed protein product [Rotaria sordida]CAF1266700.1 unnamed protein product [Rotaria sordida]
MRSIPASTLEITTSNLSTSSKRSSLPSQQKITKRTKLDITSTSANSNSNLPMDGYTILQNQLLFTLMCKTNCESCGNRWNGTINIKKREGLFVILSFQCSSCTNTITIETSPKVVASDRRDINVRSQIGGHLCGIRYAGLAKLMGAMNLPSPIQDERYSKWDKNLLLSIKSFSDRSMKKAVEEAVTAANGKELMVSGDGFWQTRGFQSRHGAAALLSCNTAPKVLDIETCSKTCNVCFGALAIKNSNPAKYNDIIRSHHYEKNYNKSSGTIEAHAVLNMFQRSVSKYQIYYTKYVGDGDSKTFAALSDKPPYPGKVIKKIEDLNHFSKRMKRQLETKKRQYGKEQLSDGKTIGGKNRLSEQNIIRLQMAFASTIRKCKHDLDLLFKRSWAIFWHKYSTNDDPRHDYCSIDWCGYLKAARDGTSYDHTPHALPRPVLDAIKPVFDNLCSRESLARVVNASSQNPNEGFHSLVWLMSPKHKTSSGTIFEIACHLAIIIFNDGYFTLGDLFNNICGYRGHYTDQAMIHFDNTRLHTESKENNRKRRKEAGRDVQKNVDNDQTNSNNASGDDDYKTIDSDEEADDDYNETNPGDQATFEDNDTTTEGNECSTDDHDSTSSSDNSSTDNDDKTILSPDTATKEGVEKNDETSDDEYGYYNPKDRRRWKEEE